MLVKDYSKIATSTVLCVCVCVCVRACVRACRAYTINMFNEKFALSKHVRIQNENHSSDNVTSISRRTQNILYVYTWLFGKGNLV